MKPQKQTSFVLQRLLLAALLTAPALLAAAGCARSDASGPTSKQATPQQSAAVEIQLATVTRGPLSATLDLVGTLIPVRATTVVSEVDGVIQSFPTSNRAVEYEENGQQKSVALGLDIGQPVRQGDVLVQINPTDFQLELNVAQAELQLAQRNLEDLLSWKRPEEIRRLQAAVTQAKATHGQAYADLGRAKPLLTSRAISQASYEEYVTAEQTARAALDQAEAALKLYEEGPTKDEIAVAQARVDAAQAAAALREEKLRKTTIRAPYDAVVSDRYVDVGDRVTAMPRVEIMQVIDPRVLFAELRVPERYQGAVSLDDTAAITAEGLRQPIAGRVELVNAKIEPATRTFRVRVAIDNRAGLLKAGGFVHALLQVGGANEVLSVPTTALVFSEGNPSVFVYRQGRVVHTPVQLGIVGGRRREIVAGLAEGQQVAVTQTALLIDGMPVRPAGPRAAAPLSASAPHTEGRP